MMTGTNIFFLAFSILLALVGLSAAAAAQEVGLSIFGFGLMLFGVLFAFGVVKRICDAYEASVRRGH